MTITDFTTRLIVALLAGLAIGFERQWHHKTAGLKTNMLVATGAAIFVLLSFLMKADESTIDVSRIIAQVVTGVGFLGAGIIFREGTDVHGLGSAATIWCSAAIGCIAASGFFMETLICTALIVLINSFLQPLDNWLKKRK
ncbi:MgtC/SapB family protein [Maribacter polysiphoniae]|uniref:MgtC/SapB family protein n=1 Tax=Maribacter polysiphoniae TaxID=429344 RepID=A0A316DU86_9FLAO|nr:MgtC/SapB family protein [Maribacter polysiphoniae]MBD1262819.1 MgtC/SapB family protein [Maribacter polysiphoniae]PWK20133.1 putative Mg2+ transporter-C (MgtC) family protein [Maribacter polysiphoniae]